MRNTFKDFLKGHVRPQILVIGDIILDEYIWGDVHRISPEAPIPILKTKSENSTLGGAANVANNLITLGCAVTLVGAIGKDEKGDRLLSMIQQRGINTDGIFRLDYRPTTSKTRILAHDQQLLRIDKEDNHPITENTENKFLQFIDDVIPIMDGVICSDYRKGVLTDNFLKKLIERTQKNGKQVIVDPKHTDFSIYEGASIITPNESEVSRSTPININSEEDLERAGQYLLNLTKAKALLVTRGKNGMTLYQNKITPIMISTEAKEVYDVTGAGDTVISVFAMAVFSGFSYENAARLSNKAASIVVGKVGTAVVTPEEINKFLQEEMLHVSNAILDLEQIKQLASLAKNTGKTVVFTNGCFDILHGGHVDFLRQAKALGNILIVGINSDTSVRAIKGNDRPIKNQTERANIIAALQYVDYITIFEELTPENLIREIRPDILVKGDDYKIDEVIGRIIVEGYGARVELVPIVAGLSTTKTLEKIHEKYKKN